MAEKNEKATGRARKTAAKKATAPAVAENAEKTAASASV